MAISRVCDELDAKRGSSTRTVEQDQFERFGGDVAELDAPAVLSRQPRQP